MALPTHFKFKVFLTRNKADTNAARRFIPLLLAKPRFRCRCQQPT